MGRNDLRGKKYQGEGGIDPFFGIIEVLDPDIYLVLVVILQFAGKKIGFICLKGQ
jgi:hypothetical protein